MARLIVVGGLPGVGKTTLARALATDLGATYLRVDVVEAPLFAAGVDVGPLGYEIVRDLARSNLALGAQVIVDLVNPLPVTRAIWTALAADIDVPLTVFECVLPDEGEHRRRVESRSSDVPNLKLPSWQDVVDRDYVPWDDARDGERIVIDTTDTEAALRQAHAALVAASP